MPRPVGFIAGAETASFPCPYHAVLEQRIDETHDAMFGGDDPEKGIITEVAVIKSQVKTLVWLSGVILAAIIGSTVAIIFSIH